MDSKLLAQLEQAKAYFYSWRMQECYNILRRYFDRLPFCPEQMHAEYIGIFCRSLLELGKQFELKFYEAELEKLATSRPDPHILYALGVLYSYSDQPRDNQTTALFLNLVKSDAPKNIREKSKMMLALQYTKKDDYVSAASLIDSIESFGDKDFDRLHIIWRAVSKRGLGRPQEAINILAEHPFSMEEDWYAYFSAKLIEAMSLVDLQRNSEAEKLASELEQIVSNKKLRSTIEQLNQLKQMLAPENKFGPVTLDCSEDRYAFIYRDQKKWIRKDTPSDKLLIQLLRRRFLSKSQIIKIVYGRSYSIEDNSLVYYQIHSLRQKLEELGLPGSSLLTEEDGYRFVPKVDLIGGSQ